MARAAEQRICAFNAQALANTAWAFGLLGLSEAQLFTALARGAEQRIRDFIAQELANTVWAFATLGLSDSQLFTALVRASEQRIRDFNAQAGWLISYQAIRLSGNDAIFSYQEKLPIRKNTPIRKITLS